MLMSGLPLYVALHHMCVWYLQKYQNRTSDALDLELQMGENRQAGPGNRTPQSSGGAICTLDG